MGEPTDATRLFPAVTVLLIDTMDIPYLITLLQNKLNYLSNARSSAAAVGDVGGVSSIDQEFLTTQNTLAQLQLLQQLSSAAAAANTTPTDLLASAVSSNAEMPIQGPSASAIINGYDISAYATDPLYEQKIHTIISALPTFAIADDLTAYIQRVAENSPVSGDMVFKSGQMYQVDIPLMVAIMQNDSEFGTKGVATTTNNPGNVGNTGYETKTYPSWQEGVDAVALWLNTHRVSGAPVVPDVPKDPEPAIPAPQEEPVITPPDVTTPDTATSTPPTDSATTTPESLPVVTEEPIPVPPPTDSATSTSEQVP